MLACALVGMRGLLNEGRRSVPPACLSACLMMDTLIHGACLFGRACIYSLFSFHTASFYTRLFSLSIENLLGGTRVLGMWHASGLAFCWACACLERTLLDAKACAPQCPGTQPLGILLGAFSQLWASCTLFSADCSIFVVPTCIRESLNFEDCIAS